MNFVTTNNGLSTNMWEAEILPFVATSNSTTISIVGNLGEDYVGLDNVALTGGPAVSAAPEPSTWALMIAGAGWDRPDAAADEEDHGLPVKRRLRSLTVLRQGFGRAAWKRFRAALLWNRFSGCAPAPTLLCLRRFELSLLLPVRGVTGSGSSDLTPVSNAGPHGGQVGLNHARREKGTEKRLA